MKNFPTWILIPVHNRRRVTLETLEALEAFGVMGWASILVVDDGSTDGTADEISAGFPMVEILRGDGCLFWTGAMEIGMKHAVTNGAECCVWMNDDIKLLPGTIEAVVELAMTRSTVVTAQGLAERGNLEPWPFALLYRSSTGLVRRDPDMSVKEPVQVDTFRGNLVAIPLAVIKRVGYPDGKNIPHLGGDSDYGLRATAAGFKCLTLLSAIFREIETFRDDNRSWLFGNQPIGKMWKQNLSKRGSLYPRMVVVYHLRHWKLRGLPGIFIPYIKLFGSGLVRKLLPKSWLIRLFGTRSYSYNFYKGLSPDE